MTYFLFRRKNSKRHEHDIISNQHLLLAIVLTNYKWNSDGSKKDKMILFAVFSFQVHMRTLTAYQ